MERKNLPPQEQQRDRWPLRQSLQQQQEGMRLEPEVKKGIRIVDPETARRRAAKFLRDLR